MALPNPSMSFSPFDILTADEMNDLVENDQALSNGTGFQTGGVDASVVLQDNSVTAAKLSLSSLRKGYAQRTSNFTTSTGSAAWVDVTSLTFTASFSGTEQIRIEAFFSNIASTQSGIAALNMRILEDNTNTVASANRTKAGASYADPYYAVDVITPAAGSHTYKVQVQQQSTGTITAEASSTAKSFILATLC